MAVITSRRALSFLEEDRLDALHEELKIEPIGSHPQS
jgi:hypothetical protein